jgi:hypothetical protein
MKKKILTVAAAMALCLATVSFAETVHQKSEGANAYASGGGAGSAVEKKLMEVKTEEKADSGKIARVAGSVKQWGFVSYWFGIPTPAGKATLRFRIYVDDDAVADFGVYRVSKSGQDFLAKLKIPADAKPKTYVTVDVPVDSKDEWSGITLKKMDNSDKPSPWIDTVSVVLP